MGELLRREQMFFQRPHSGLRVPNTQQQARVFGFQLLFDTIHGHANPISGALIRVTVPRCSPARISEASVGVQRNVLCAG